MAPDRYLGLQRLGKGSRKKMENTRPTIEAFTFRIYTGPGRPTFWGHTLSRHGAEPQSRKTPTVQLAFLSACMCLLQKDFAKRGSMRWHSRGLSSWVCVLGLCVYRLFAEGLGIRPDMFNSGACS